MRLVFYCPLTARIGHHLREFSRLKSHGAYRKYHYFIPHFFNHRQREVAIYWEGIKTPDYYGYLKCFVWMLINGINPLKVKILDRIDQLDPQKDVLLGFPFLSFNAPFLTAQTVFAKYEGLKVFHFSHYFNETEKIGSFIRSLSNTLIIGDGNLQRNPLYQKYMGDKHPFHSLPFALKNRYQKVVDFHKRKSKCLSVGTKSKICPQLHKEFFQLFKADYLHPLRNEIFQKKEKIQEFIESLIYDFQEASDFSPKNWREKAIVAITKKIGNDRRRFFSFDIVQKYNEYQMFVSPEEECGIPSIGFMEGMACGCAYLGRPEFYIDFGMKPGVHFIPYNGTLTDLIEKIQFHQKHPEVTAQIAENGWRFARERFAPEKVANEFWDFLENYANRN